MTDHRRARLAAKSARFLAQRAQAAGVGGDRSEAQRLLTAALRKRTTAHTAGALAHLARFAVAESVTAC